ncbi:MAG: glycoside hydrolase family 172 protein [Gemmatimonadota bacterium]
MLTESILNDLSLVRTARTGRFSSWDTSGRNSDAWTIAPGETRLLADIDGPGMITHIWMTQRNHYRECLLKITWDNARHPSVLVPLGDFFGLGHNLVNSYQSLLFTASTRANNQFNQGCALNAYPRMPFRERARVELVNESSEPHRQYFYIDYEQLETSPPERMGYFHAEFRRENPFGGWGHEIRVNTPEADIVNKERTAWENNYVILETRGCGHYLGCNLSVTNFQGTWWGEGDDMIWVDGYKWPPDLHGTGSEDYLNQAWGMQPNAFLRNGSSLHEANTDGYQTSYVHHLENPVRFQREIKVTIEHGHGNHLCNEMSSVAYWYALEPTRVAKVPAVAKRLPVLRDNQGTWLYDKKSQTTSRRIAPNREMKAMKARWAKDHP